jgi:hypothetical protein
VTQGSPRGVVTDAGRGAHRTVRCGASQIFEAVSALLAVDEGELVIEDNVQLPKQQS